MRAVINDAAVLSLSDADPKSDLDRAAAILGAADPSLRPGEVAHLPLGERDRRLLDVRAATIGPDLRLVLACPDCGELSELTVDATVLVPPNAPATSVTVRSGTATITARPLTSADLDAAALEDSVDAARRVLVRRCLVAATDGAEVLDLDVLAGELDDEVIVRLAERLEEADPGAELSFALRCSGCDATIDASLDVCRLTWTELSRRSRALFHDIDVLAARYGWTEQQILQLPAKRRRRYVEMAG